MYVIVREAHAVLRVFEDGKVFGDGYVWACSVIRLDENTIELAGITKPPTPSVWRAIKEYAQDEKLNIKFIRIREDGSTHIKLVRYKER